MSVLFVSLGPYRARNTSSQEVHPALCSMSGSHKRAQRDQAGTVHPARMKHLQGPLPGITAALAPAAPCRGVSAASTRCRQWELGLDGYQSPWATGQLV